MREKPFEKMTTLEVCESPAAGARGGWMRTRFTAALLACCGITIPLFAQNKSSARLAESTAVLKAILDNERIPKSVVDKEVCVLVFPGVKKVGIGIGVTYGRGMITC